MLSNVETHHQVCADIYLIVGLGTSGLYDQNICISKLIRVCIGLVFVLSYRVAYLIDRYTTYN